MITWRGAIIMILVTVVLGITLALRPYWPVSSFLSFANVREGQQLSGNTAVLARFRGNIYLVALCIDGRNYAERITETYGVSSSGRSVRTVQFDVPTYLYRNGVHTLQIKSGSKIYDQRHVTFQNVKHPG